MDALPLDPLIAKGAGGTLGGAVALSLDPPKTRGAFTRRMFVPIACDLAAPARLLLHEERLEEQAEMRGP